jgi:hypothetical protein
MTDAQYSQQAVEKRLARSYEHPSYDDPYDVVIDYRRVQRAAANHPNKGSTALANIVELPRGRIRGWIDDEADRMPDAVRGINVAHNKGWVAPNDETARALSALAGHILGGGSITTQNFVPNVSEGRRVSVSAIQNAFRSVGVQSGRRHAEDKTRATEVIPTEHASILGRTLVAWGCPVGSRSNMTSVPEILDAVASRGRVAFLEAYILHRAVNYEQKATSRLQGQQPAGFHQAIAELIQTVTGEAASYDSRGVTVSAAAMRALELDE